MENKSGPGKLKRWCFYGTSWGIHAPPISLDTVNPDWDTFTGLKEVTKIDGGGGWQRGGHEVTELLS